MTLESFHLHVVFAGDELSGPVGCVDHDGMEEHEDVEEVEERFVL